MTTKHTLCEKARSQEGVSFAHSRAQFSRWCAEGLREVAQGLSDDAVAVIEQALWGSDEFLSLEAARLVLEFGGLRDTRGQE